MIKRAFPICLWLLLTLVAQGQYKVHFVLKHAPQYAVEEKVYLVGNFNNWNPGDPKMAFSREGKDRGITIELTKGMYEYKLTRGSWQKVEVAGTGGQKENRKLNLSGDTTIELAVDGWTDHFPAPARRSTISRNVRVIDTAFFIPQLNRHRRVWIYLPESYTGTSRRFPVLYMHDAQNVFDDATSFSGEWGVDEALDTLGKHMQQSIVVAIDNGGDKRLNEYSPYDMEKYGKGEGSQYVDFLVNTLKPFIDKHYRTQKDAAHTFIAGSSMGGLISLYAILKYPNIYGGAGIFSPAFWIAPKLLSYIDERGSKVKGRVYFYAGKQESESMVPDMLAAFERLHKISKAKMEVVIRDEGKHNEPTWRKEFPAFYQWLFNHQAGK